MRKNVVVLGSLAREHAIAQALERSNPIPVIHCMGTTHNGGIHAICTRTGGLYRIGDVCSAGKVLDFCTLAQASLLIIGPEAPLEAGIGDAARSLGIAVVGPNREQARIETSKSFARKFLSEILHQACPRYRIIEHLSDARHFIEKLGGRYVVKADGLSGGKGVKISQEHLMSIEEGLAYCGDLLSTEPGRCVVEEKLEGEEFSLITITDGEACVHFPAVQDHKRAYEQDTGPNTGGMGSYTDSDHSLPFLFPSDRTTAASYNEQVIRALAGKTGEPYRGVLYGGFMATADGVKIIEYNARLGDPEALNLLSLLTSDAFELFERAATGNLAQYQAQFLEQASVCLYAVPTGYPLKKETGKVITIEPMDPGSFLYYGSVDELPDGSLVTCGSRAVAVVALEDTIAKAHEKAVEHIAKIRGEVRYRADIGSEQLIARRIEHMERLRRPLSVAVLGSTRGTDLDYLVSAIRKGALPATISVVISDNPDAGILKKASGYGIEAIVVNSERNNLRDQQITAICEERQVDLIVLIGYMRILGRQFCEHWNRKIINVHPSLLPDFAGRKDSDVHAAAIERMRETGERTTGCTVHIVTPEVDSGPILIQRTCLIADDDTPETLKRKVQALEGEALCACIAKAQLYGGDLGRCDFL